MSTLPVPALRAQALARPHTQTRFLRQHLGWPLLATAVASAALMGAGLDQRIADLLYRLEGGHWLLQRHWLTAGLVHHDGKLLSVTAGVALLLAALLPPLRRWRRALLYVVASVALSTLAVSMLKSLTHMDCPWDLLRYGGPRPFVGLFASRHGLPASGCFPAGHASAGYAWVALYFAAFAVRPRWRWAGLAIGLGSGALFGLSQQLRGAHFLSHDLWALATCWLVALALYLGMLRRPRQGAPEVQA